MCPAIKKFDRQNRLLILALNLLDHLIRRLDPLILDSERTRIQAYMDGHAPFPFMCSVRDQHVRKIAVADGSTAVTTPRYIVA